MTIAAKITKEATAHVQDGYNEGRRVLSGYLTLPKRDAKPEQFFHIEGNRLTLDKAVLDKYKIAVEVA